MARYRGVDGVARQVIKRHRGVDGVAHTISKSYRGVDGVARCYYGSGAVLKVLTFEERSGATVVHNETNTALTASVSGGVDTNYAAVIWVPYSGGEPLLFKAGDVVKFSFTGTRYWQYCDYGFRFYDPNGNGGSSYENMVGLFYNRDYTDYEYTVTQDCMLEIVCQVGGIFNSNLYATISVTNFQINGERIWT